eukprot:10529069-Prorocentrum_lima.AAC.1
MHVWQVGTSCNGSMDVRQDLQFMKHVEAHVCPRSDAVKKIALKRKPNKQTSSATSNAKPHG